MRWKYMVIGLLVCVLFLVLASRNTHLTMPSGNPVILHKLTEIWQQLLPEEIKRMFPGKQISGSYTSEALDIMNDDNTEEGSKSSSSKVYENSWEFNVAASPSDVKQPVRETAEKITKKSNSSYETAELIYRWITRNIAYDVDKYNKGEPYVPDALKTLQSRKGICGDYALLAHEMFISAGLEAEIKSGEVITDRGVERHAWNEVNVGEEIYALDTTWGAGFLDAEGQQFIHRPNSIFFTTPEDLGNLHGNANYREEKLREWMREESIKSSPEFIPSYEHGFINFLNHSRKELSLNSLEFCDDLQEEARRLALKVSEKECRGESWSMDLETSRERLNQNSPGVSTLVARVYFYWGYLNLDQEEIHRGWLDDDKSREVILSPEYDAVGVGVVKQGDLFVVTKLIGHYR